MDQVRTYRWRKERARTKHVKWFPTWTEQSFYYDNNFANFSTVHWQMSAFKTKLRSSKFLLAFQSNTLLKQHGPKQPWGIYSSKNGLIFVCVCVCVIRGSLRATLFWLGPLRIQGYWPEWRPSNEVIQD